MIYPPRSIFILFASMAAVAIAVGLFGGTAATSIKSAQEISNNAVPVSAGQSAAQKIVPVETLATSTAVTSSSPVTAPTPPVTPVAHSVSGRSERESREDE